MIINCPNCPKKFRVERNLIPAQGRLLQCSNCNHKWFFKISEDNEEAKFLQKEDLSKKKNDDNDDKIKKNNLEIPFEENNNTENSQNFVIKDSLKSKKKNKKKTKINYLKVIPVILISIIAFIILLDTFKNQISNIFPQINNLMENLYETLKDLSLFIKDLFSK